MGGPPQGEYEFNDTENAAITDLASKMRFVGLMGVIFGVLLMLAGIGGCASSNPGGLGNVIQGVLSLMIGLWTRSAADAFKRIVDTQGSDIFNLMSALGELRRIYGLQRTLFIIVIVLFALMIPLGFVLFARGVPSHM
jgi:hypothetical protein